MDESRFADTTTVIGDSEGVLSLGPTSWLLCLEALRIASIIPEGLYSIVHPQNPVRMIIRSGSSPEHLVPLFSRKWGVGFSFPQIQVLSQPRGFGFFWD